MTNNGTSDPNQYAPFLNIKFSVKIGDKEFIFSEASGLSNESQVIEYRAGNSAAFSTVKMPGISNNSKVILKRGVANDARHLQALRQEVGMNTIKRINIVIELLDESNSATFSWNLSNAFVTKLTIADAKAGAAATAISTMEIACEGVQLINAIAD
jgi:phage tail-like protein